MNKALNKQIGKRVRTQREYLGITREGLCDYVNISPQFLSEVERGVKGVSAETLYKLCEGLGISADFVLMGKEHLPDVSAIVKTLSTLDEKYIPLAEDLLKTFFKTIALK
ncbi:MAG: helix-turn-helix domain-containing protein [Oscillospiraceae bacterium]|nr:helix-turn-helix domain-containing protein [Oscillospiraceae bacterium]